jgi:adenine phosphoribosyltransferase
VRSMAEEHGAHWAGSAVIVDQTTPAVRAGLGVPSIVSAAELPARVSGLTAGTDA